MKKEEKKDYQKPELIEHGNVKEITHGISGAGDDEDAD